MTLQDNTRKAIVNMIAVCDPDSIIHVQVSMTQGSATGFGAGHSDCNGALMQFPVVVEATGPNPFAAGPAIVAADATIVGHHSPERLQWTRTVQVSP